MKLKRDLRYVVEPSDTTKVVRFHDFQGKEHTCQIRDYSRTGLSFVMEEGSLIFKIGDIIKDLRFYSQDREIFKGQAHIIHIQEEEEEYDKLISRVGCSFSDNFLDVYSIIRVDKVTRLQNEFMDFVQSMAIEEGLDPEFVNLTSRLHYVFAGFQEKLTKEEESINKESEELIPILRETLRDLAYDALRDELSRYYDHLSKVTSRFADSKLHYIHKEFFQKRLHPFLLKSKLFNRAFEKPLGYAGDYEMMNIIYRNDFEGDDVFSQIMNKIDCDGSGARAVRNRRSYLYDKIMKTMEKGMYTGEGALKIMSVACGPAMEVYDVLVSLKGKRLSREVEFIGIDQDRNAINDASSRINPLCKGRSDFKVKLLEDNIKRLIVGKEVNNEMYKGINLIYSAGLFDYLSERASMRLVNRLYNFLAPDGLLIIGNFGSYNPQRFIMEYGAEWYLFHRSEEDLKALASGVPEDASMEVEREPEGVNLFLNIRKPG